MVSARANTKNRLLAALQPRDFALLSAGFETVTLKTGDVLFRPGENVECVHFPEPGTIAALVLDLRDGAISEAAMVGQEGALGGIVSEGDKPAFATGVVQIGGGAQRLSIELFDRAKARSPAMRDHFARYADCLLAQVLQSTACNAVHDLDARLARWLLTLRDRLESDEIGVTQDFIAQMLGVHRPYATRIIGDLERTGAIRRGRANVTVVDVRRLELQACECYGYLRRHFERLLPGVYPG
ncbi:MAG: Crp/Fnr family transcriptional regulator [Rhizomicrobium sp.]